MPKQYWIYALALVSTCTVPAAAMAQTAPLPLATISGTRLDVVATGVSRQAPDIAEISAGVLTEAATAGTAMASNAQRMAAVVKALKAAGVADRDIQTTGLSLSPRYRYRDNMPPELTGYQASNMVRILLRKIADSGRIIDTLVAQGANQINGPSFRIDKPEAALDAARREAMTIGRTRAELYAASAGLRVKRIIAISEQPGMMPPPYPVPVIQRAMAESKADTPVEAGENELSVTLNLTFELE